MQVCPNCGEENPDRFRLCGICGTPLARAAPPQEVRKTVSIVFSDLKGSTTLGERLDTEALREVLTVYFSEMQAVLERHGGTVEKFIGDAIMAVFGLPRLHEDDALRAVRAAYEMKQTLERINDRLEAGWGIRLENRTGVNTGEVVAGDVTAGQRLVTGDAVNTAARLEQAAPACDILIGGPTYRLVKDSVEVETMEPLELKGKAGRVAAYRLLSVARAGEGVARRLDAPMVGRTGELQVLMEALERAERVRRAQRVTVFGPAGVGKSRLLREFLDRTGERITALRGRCLSYGDGITFWPLAEIVREAAGIAEEDSLDVARSKLFATSGEQGREAAERVAAAIGLSPETFPVQETFWGARRLLELLGGDRPAVIMIDDIHWAEDTFLEMLQYITETAEAPIVLLCSSRPELLEEHAEWVQQDKAMKPIVLEPLSDEESAKVVENLLGTTAFDERMGARIIEAAEGNPLFVEQMLSMLIDDGILHRDAEGAWVVVGDLGAITIPPSISALLTARLDRLGPNERAVTECGAVVGQVFFRGAVEALSPEDVRERVPRCLVTLTAKELIRPDETMFAGQEAYRFVHILIRDAAYHGLLKRTRAELHERFVDWLETVASGRVLEYEEIRGYHLEQAFLILLQLGPLDDRTRALGIRGAGHLSSAGHRALARGDMPAAANLLRRAASLLPEADEARPGLLLAAGEAMIDTGEFTEADAALSKARDEAGAIGDRALETTAQLVRLQLHYTTDPEDSDQRVAREVERAIPILEELGAHGGLARAWRLLTLVHYTAGRWGVAERTARSMIEQARLAGDRLMEARVLPSLATCALYGPLPAPEAIKRCEEVLARCGGDRKAEALTMCALAHLEAMQGRFDRARELYRRARASFEELGWRLHAALTSIDSGPIELLAGDPEAAERELRRDYEALERMGERNYISTTAGYLAEALYQQGRYGEAERFAAVCEEVAAPDDVSSQSMWRLVRGKVLASHGRLEEAEALVRQALGLIADTDDLDSLGGALLDLAEVLIRAGRGQEAEGVLADAVRRFQDKGNVVSAGRARALADALASGDPVLERGVARGHGSRL